MTPAEIATQAAQLLSSHLLVNHQQGIPTLLLVSGGSALQIVSQIPDEAIGDNLTITVLDERYSSDPAINNFHQLMETSLYKSAVKNNSQFIDTRIQKNETADQLASRFEGALRAWQRKYPSGKTIITQGMGADGHTAGIMPYPEDSQLFRSLFNNPEMWVTSYDAGKKNQYPIRVTTTLPFLRMVDVSIFYVCGLEKIPAMKKMTQKDTSIEEIPAKITQEMKKVSLFTDN